MPTTSKRILVDLLNTCDTTRILHGTAEDTHEKRDRTWRRWHTFLLSLHLQNDPYLDNLQHEQRINICLAFFQALRSGQFGSGSDNKRRFPSSDQRELRLRTIQAAASQLAAQFRCNGRPSPIHFEGDPNRKHPRINELFRAWDKLDPPTKKEAALTTTHLLFIHENANNKNDPFLLAQAQLLTAAFFFACRSCEYSSVTNRGRTKLLRIRNITFLNDDIMPIPKGNIQGIASATLVQVCFEDQKNAHKADKRTQRRTSHPILCPVKALASTVTRILSYTKHSEDSPINSFIDPTSGIQRNFSQQSTNETLRSTCAMKPASFFGYNTSDIGSHSIRSGAAMALFMANVEPMRLGRWSSDAFLQYIRPNVTQWTSTMSQLMSESTDFRAYQDNPLTDTHQITKHKIPTSKYTTEATTTGNTTNPTAEREKIGLFDKIGQFDFTNRSNLSRHPDDPLRRGDHRSILSHRTSTALHGSTASQSFPTKFHTF